MANEFIARKGLISLGDSQITGSNSLAGNYALKVTNTSGADILNVENNKKVIINSTDIPSTSLIIGNPPNPNYNIEIASGSYNTMRFASNTNNGGEHKIGFAGHTSTTNMGAAIIGKATGASGRVNLFFALGAGDSNEADTTDSVITLAYNDINFYQPVHAQDDTFEIGGSNTGDSILYLGAEKRIGVARDYRGAGNAADFVVVTPGTLGGTSIPTTHTRLRVTKEGDTELSGSLTANQGIDVIGDVSASTYYGDGSNLTGISSDPFPYTGSAIISGSLNVIGDITASGDLSINGFPSVSASLAAASGGGGSTYQTWISGKGQNTSQATFGTSWRGGMSGNAIGAHYVANADTSIITFTGTPSVGDTDSANNYKIITAIIHPNQAFTNISWNGFLRAYNTACDGNTQNMEIWTLDDIDDLEGLSTTTLTYRGGSSWTYAASNSFITPFIINGSISYTGTSSTAFIVTSHVPTNPASSMQFVYNVDFTIT